MVISAPVVLLRAFLVVLFLILLVFQFVSLPGTFAYLAEQHPDQASLRWPLTAVAVFWVLCVQVVVVCTWRLLSLVEADRIFTEVSLAWVDGIVGPVGVLLGVGALVVAVRTVRRRSEVDRGLSRPATGTPEFPPFR
jgi:hypothetical protein